MRKLAALLSAICFAAPAVAEDGILNHLDLGVSAGTTGIGIDVAMPVGKSVRLRAGYTYMPRFKLSANFPVQTSQGISLDSYAGKFDQIPAKLASYGIDINDPAYATYKELFDKISTVGVTDHVTMDMKPTFHQFKFMVDVMPFRNKHWSFSAGFFAGPARVGEAVNSQSEALLLECINAYNDFFLNTYTKQGIDGVYINFLNNGVVSFPLGRFDNGDRAVMVPNADNTVRAVMEVSKFRPYLGCGYNTNLSRNKRWKLDVDAGVMFLCGSPKVYADNVYRIDKDFVEPDVDNYQFDVIRWYEDENYQLQPDRNPLLDHIDIVHDVKGIPGKVGDWVKTASHLKVYPNVSVTFSYRLF